MLTHWPLQKHNLREGKREHYFSRRINTMTQFYFPGILTNSVLEEGKNHRNIFFYQPFQKNPVFHLPIFLCLGNTSDSSTTNLV